MFQIKNGKKSFCKYDKNGIVCCLKEKNVYKFSLNVDKHVAILYMQSQQVQFASSPAFFKSATYCTFTAKQHLICWLSWIQYKL